ncbi:MAG: gliding motility-associated C-terminal domain-containing protein, partial [Bacteroidales bacterium]
WDYALIDGEEEYMFDTTSKTEKTISPPVGMHRFSVIGTDQHSCVSHDTTEVLVRELPVCVLPQDTAFCEDEYIILDAGPDKDSYEWNTGETTQHIRVDTTGYYAVRVSEYSCYNSDTLFVQVHSMPTPHIGADTAICEDTFLSLRTEKQYETYEWNTTATSREISVNTEGTYKVTVSEHNCFASDSLYVRVKPLPQILFPSDTSICRGDSIVLDAGNADSYMWNSGDTTRTKKVSEEGVYFVRTELESCVSNASLSLSLRDLPELTLQSPYYVCEQGRLSVKDEFDSYVWDDGSTSSFIDVSESGMHVLRVEKNNCFSYDSVECIVEEPITARIQGPDYMCKNDTVTLSSEPDALHYTWNTGDTTQFIHIIADGTYSVHVSNNACSDTDVFEIKGKAVPSFTIEGDTLVCEGALESRYNIHGNIENADMLWETAKNNETTFSVFPGRLSYIDWHIPGMDTIRVRAVNNWGCSYTQTQPVYVSPEPHVDFNYINNNDSGVEFRNLSEPAEIEEVSVLLSNKAYWHFGRDDDTMQLVHATDTMVSYPYGEYDVELLVVNEFGCSNMITKDIFVDVYNSLYIPNTFCPNHFSHDIRVFKPTGVNLVSYKIWVFDSWGNVVWYSDKLENGQPVEAWDGTYNGEPLQSDMYFWKVEAEFSDGSIWPNIQMNKEHKGTHGSVFLLR